MRFLGLDIRRSLSPEQEAEEVPLRKRLHRLEIAFGELVEHHNALQAAHMKLRNQFNGWKGGRPRGDDDDKPALDRIPIGDKAALRRALGVVPGKPFQHKQE